VALLRSLRFRLALGFLAVTLAAVGTIYLYVIPQLREQLLKQKLDALAVATQSYTEELVAALEVNQPPRAIAAAVRRAADDASARVTLFAVRGTRPALRVTPRADSNEDVLPEGFAADVAAQAALTRRTQTGLQRLPAGVLAQAARPLRRGGRVRNVVVFSQPLSDVEGNVAVIRRQVLVAGAIAVVIALLAAGLVARTLVRRMRRLETASRAVARGDFSQPIPVEADDELGQLARAFNEMQRQLAQLDRARKQFIATASHELRTPIFSLGGFVELLQDEDLDEETRVRFLGQVRDQIARLTTLTSELLDLSRLEAGSLELRPEPTDVGGLTRTVAAEFTPALRERHSELALRLLGEPIEATCDPDRVAQIIRILVDNALTHTPAGTRVDVVAGRENGALRLAVHDRGPGIPPEALGHIFEPFYTSNDTHGSGLGLAIARELAERMEGSLDVRSRPGRTVFTLELPAH
jgi:signal transduction histidine kinase